MSIERGALPSVKRIAMVGTFPPPMHGMAAINAAVQGNLVSEGADVLVLDVAAPTLHRGLWSRLGRLPRVVRGLSVMLLSRKMRERVVYMSLSGGTGQLYDLAFMLIMRLRMKRIFLHHHSFAYLDRRSMLTQLLVSTAGKLATHVTLSPVMAERLRIQYPGVGPVISISNAVLMLSPELDPPPAKSRLRTIGFLSNISAEKGVHEFLDVCAAIQEKGLPINAMLAGPFQDPGVERSVRERLSALPGVTYVGSIYGADKAKFYADIDVLLFPTRYANEAEPLTVHEAIREGLPVIAYGRGAIPEILTTACGTVVPVGAGFVGPAMARLNGWLADPESLRSASLAASARFTTLYAENVLHWQELKNGMFEARKRLKVASAP